MTRFDDPKLQWYEVFNDGETVVMAAQMGLGCLIQIGHGAAHFVPGVKIKKETGDMDRARLVKWDKEE